MLGDGGVPLHPTGKTTIQKNGNTYTVYTPEQREQVIQSILDVLKTGVTIKKACVNLGIPPSTLYYWMDKDPKLRSKFVMQQMVMLALAERNVGTQLEEGNIDVSQWFLERRHPEYRTKVETENKTITLQVHAGEELLSSFRSLREDAAVCGNDAEAKETTKRRTVSSARPKRHPRRAKRKDTDVSAPLQ